MGGPARLMVDVRDASILPEVAKRLGGSGLTVITLGGGSNLIVADAGFNGAVLRFTGSSIVRDNGTTVAETGAMWQDVVHFHNDLGMSGMERMTGIPGWLGGAVYGNAG
ncbi:MAG: FAD-binding protein, partial [Chloroflexia bacterium]